MSFLTIIFEVMFN